MRNLLVHAQSQEPPVSQIDFNLSDCLQHAANTIGNLLPGTYKLVETVPPKGYVLMPSPITIVVTNEGATYQQGEKEPITATYSEKLLHGQLLLQTPPE